MQSFLLLTQLIMVTNRYKSSRIERGVILKNKVVVSFLAMCVFGFTNATNAAPNVSSPYVTKGEKGVELKKPRT